ncbi:hypothetical protein [Christiangramia sp. OXR-203]|uniref:hypothetical protein n=1 Tax=Christiangramia sp. OXR-203 TaxID=3100176 RepID=UPI002AC8F4EA|nr:hypothetical protein [Christiangramia sp. OXR-203]WPY97630.1 hypothetical protein T8I65_10635 [Christiangramia sp. OXR-203]
MRNYAQHCGLPTGSIIFNENADGKSLKIKISRNALLEKYDSWGKLVKSELEKQEEEFDLIPLLDELVDIVGEINREMDSIIIKGFQRQGFYLFSLIDEAQKKETGTPCILKFLPGNKKSDFKIGWFPIQIISKVTGIKIVE